MQPKSAPLPDAARYEATADGVLVQAYFRKFTDEEWRVVLDYMLARKNSLKASIAYVHGDSGPTPKQRAALVEAVKLLPIRLPFAMVTDSAIARATVTAFTWISNTRDVSAAFSPAELEEALTFLRLSERERVPVRALLASFNQTQARHAVGR
jgi:hypothetical protein